MLKKIAIFSLILAAFSLYAEGEYEGKLQETVVTATGFSDNIENQIKNITVITSEDIQEKGYNNVEDILKQAPGVNIIKIGDNVKQISLESIPAELAKLPKELLGNITVTADEHLEYGIIVETMAKLKNNNIKNINLNIQKNNK